MHLCLHLFVIIFFSHKDYQISQLAALLQMQDAVPELKHHYKYSSAEQTFIYDLFVTATLPDIKTSKCICIYRGIFIEAKIIRGTSHL